MVKMLRGVELRKRWAEYFEQVLNVADVREANIDVVGNWWMPVLGDLNERAISLEEVREAVNEIKIWQGFRTAGISSGIFKEKCYGSVRMASYDC